MAMKGITLTFKKEVPNGTDSMGNATTTTTDIAIDNCLIAPITEPSNAREQQAIEQMRDQVRIHLPKANTTNIGDSMVVWGGKTFKVDSSGVPFMDENTPGPWNRYFRAECING